MTKSEYHHILGVDEDATHHEIKKAFRRMAKKYHPDHYPDDSTAGGKFRKICEAYSILYIQSSVYESSSDNLAWLHKPYSKTDIFPGNGGRGGFMGEPQKGNDLELEAEISFRDAAMGVEKSVGFCSGGVCRELKILIPAGVENGSRICIPGKGSEGKRGGHPGDFILIVCIKPDPLFTREGADLFIARSISATAARLGESACISTLEGDRYIRIPAGIESGTKIRLKGYGIKSAALSTIGDLYVTIDVQVSEDSSGVVASVNIDVLSRYSVIMVDDEQNSLLSLKRSFRHEPYSFLCVGSGAEGLELLAVTPLVAVIISDQRMPDMNGSEFLSRSREGAPDAIRMLLTGYSDMGAIIAAMNTGGATHYITKPWEDLALIQTVRDAVRQYHLVTENLRQQEIINQQNEELLSWNINLKDRVLVQTAQIRKQVEDVHTLNRRQKANLQGLVETLATLIDLRDTKSRLHAANTAALSVSIATSMRLPKKDVETIRTAALLHDIGKNAMSDVALAVDEEDLVEEDRRHFYEHPVLGQTAIDTIEELRPAGILIRHHHERFDGNGFPDGLAGDAIPPGAAIIALADRCDREMNFHRGVNAVDMALEELSAQIGSSFSPELFPCLSQAAHDLYDSRYKNSPDAFTELTVDPSRLRVGMILTHDLFSASGLFLLGSGRELNDDNICSLQRIFALDPLRGGIHVGIPIADHHKISRKKEHTL
jgi:putative nucleotidyltransferase with HDIG domain